MYPLPPDDCRPPASPEQIAQAEKALGTTFPQDYRAFLAFSNGFDGEIAGHYLVLWGTDMLAELASGYDVLPPTASQVMIGSNGGPTAFALMGGNYVSFPFVFAGPLEEEIRVLATDFTAFLQAIAAGEGW